MDQQSYRPSAGSTARVSVAVLLALTAIALTAATAAAAPASCTVRAVGTLSGTADLSQAHEWHLRRADAVTVRLLASTEQGRIDTRITIFGFGFALPPFAPSRYVYFIEGPDQVSDLSRLARTLPVSVRTDSCSAALLVVVDDQNPLLTLVGGAGGALAALSLLSLLLLARSPGRLSRRILGGIAGLVGGFGLSLLLQQLLWLDPRSYDTLLPAGLGLVFGTASPGLLHPGFLRPSRP